MAVLEGKVHSLKRLICIALIACLPAFAANPFGVAYRTVKGAVTGKYGWSLSVLAYGTAEGCDYKTTVKAVTSGVGVEANPLLTNSQGVLVQDRLMAFKALSFIVPVSAEAFMYEKFPSFRAPRYVKWATIGHWAVAAAVGAVAYHNREIYQRAQ